MTEFVKLVSVVLVFYHGRSEAEAARLLYRHVSALMAGAGFLDARATARAILAAEGEAADDVPPP